MPEAFLPREEQAALHHLSPRDLQLGDHLMLPQAYPDVISYAADKCYLSGPITWLTDMSEFRSGHGIKGEMLIKFTDSERPAEIRYDFYGIDFVSVYVSRRATCR